MRLLTAEEVADQLQVPQTWVYRAAREGLLPSVACGRYVRFHPSDLEAWVRKQRESSTVASPPPSSGPRDAPTPGGLAHRGKDPQ